MRILFLSQFFQPEPMFKGLPFVRALCARGHEVEVLTGFPNYPGGEIYPGYKIRAIQREIFDGIKITRVPLFPSHDSSGIKRMMNYLSFGASAATFGLFVTKPPDVIYVYNLVTLSIAWRWLRYWRKCAVVLDVQDLWPESVISSGMTNSKWVRNLLTRFCHSAYTTPDRLTVLSSGFKIHLMKLGIPAVKIDVIYNWCDESLGVQTNDQAMEIRRHYGFEGRFNVLFAGTMGKVQALDQVIEAAKLVQVISPEVLFTFLGGGVEVDRLMQHAAGMTNVQFLTRRPSAEAAELISVADALLVHLKRDPLFSITIPSKTQAYLHAGKPILMGAEGDAAALIREANAGICFKPEDPISLAQAVCDIARMSKDDRQKLGSNGKRFYDERLSFACGIRKFEAVFEAARAQKSCNIST
jgi:colanic acid biosynthesis glycosyl transferase WcaI